MKYFRDPKPTFKTKEIISYLEVSSTKKLLFLEDLILKANIQLRNHNSCLLSESFWKEGSAQNHQELIRSW